MKNRPHMRDLLDQLLREQTTPEEVCRPYPELLAKVRSRWQRMRRVQAELDVLFPPATESAARPGDLFDDGIAMPTIPGYEMEALLGRGGMGVVFRARHIALDRVVALKMTLSGAYAGPHERERFQREAEAVARLRHTGVVQIHDVGNSEGRPYFTMELLEGGSLAQKLAGTPQPAGRAAELLITLAGAVQAAHDCGILHRDLKPANILLTGDGNPKISDFGLARRFDNELDLTRSGMPVGTPSYMAPEQAGGKRVHFGPAIDIYSLGAILYELLTGRPPFRAETASATIQQVLSEDPAPPSRLNARVPRDLETICMKCLRKEPEKRYGTARELADDLRRFLRGEPVTARPIGTAETIWNWVKRRPTAAALLFALSLLMAGATTSACVFYQQRAAARATLQQTDREVRSILARGRNVLDEGWLTQDLARVSEAATDGAQAADLAHRLVASASVCEEAVAFRNTADASLQHARRNRVLLEELLDVSAPQDTGLPVRDEAGLPTSLAQQGHNEQYAVAFQHWGIDIDAASDVEVATRLLEEPDLVVQEVIAALDAWMIERRRQRPVDARWQHLFRVAERLDHNESHHRMRTVLVSTAPGQPVTIAAFVAGPASWPALWELERGQTWRQLRTLRASMDPRKEPVLSVVLLTSTMASIGDFAGAEETLRQAATARPDQVILLNALGKLLLREGDRRLEEAIGYLRAVRSQRRHLGVNLSSALLQANRFVEAKELLQELMPEHPDNPALHFLQGNTASLEKKYEQAVTAYNNAIQLHPAFAEAYYNLAIILSNQHKIKQAEAGYRKAIEIRPDFPEAHTNLGLMLFQQRKFAQAEAACRRALDLKPDLVNALVDLGSTLIATGRFSEARNVLHKATNLEPNLAAAQNNLGRALLGLGEFSRAESAIRKAVELAPDLPQARINLGNALEAQGEYSRAEEAFRKAIEIAPNRPDAYVCLGIAFMNRRQFADAEAEFRRAIRVEPNCFEAYDSLGNLLLFQRKHNDADAAYRQAVRLNPDFAEAHLNLGITLEARQKYADAATMYQKSIDLKPGLVEAYSKLGKVLVRLGKLSEGEKAFRKAVDLRPNSAMAYFDLGSVLSAQKKDSQSEAIWRKVIALQPNNAEAFFCLGKCLIAQGKYDEARIVCRRTTKLRPFSSLAYVSLGIVQERLGNHAESEAMCRIALGLNPRLPEAHGNLGIALLKQGRLAKAFESFLTAARLCPRQGTRSTSAQQKQ